MSSLSYSGIYHQNYLENSYNGKFDTF